MDLIQKELFLIYLETRRVCDKLNLKLIVSGGTLLGVVRHKGFIPWDDDMDFYMFRDEYKVFSKLIDKKYFVQCHKTDHDWYRDICKIRKNNTTAIEIINPHTKSHQGLWIDIFPLDVQTTNEDEYLKHLVKSRELYKRMDFHWLQQESTLKEKIKNIMFGHRRLLVKHPFLRLTYNQIEKQAKKFNNTNHKYLGVSYFVMRKKYKIGLLFVYPKKIFDKVYDVPFECSKVTIISEYDKLLTQQYGNWHQIPPPEKRILLFILLLYMILIKTIMNTQKIKNYCLKFIKNIGNKLKKFEINFVEIVKFYYIITLKNGEYLWQFKISQKNELLRFVIVIKRNQLL